MNNEQPPQTHKSNEMDAWFQYVNETAPSTPPTTRRPKHTPIILAIIGALIAIAAVVAYFIYANRGICLTEQDLAGLTTDQASQPFNPAVDFYTTTFYFSAGSTSFDAESKADASATIKSIVDFYNKHKDIPMTINLTPGADSAATTTVTDATVLRAEKIKSELISGGIPTGIIHTLNDNYSQESTDEDDGSADETYETLDTVILSLTSSQGCR